MKKLITLTFALMLTASMAFAQNNEAQTSQSGSGATVTIDQAGADNFARTDQTGTGSEIIINQVGDANLIQAAERTGVEDFGDNNFTQVNQIGNSNLTNLDIASPTGDNQINIDQGVDGNTSNGSSVRGFLEGFNNVFDIDQRGTSQVFSFVLNGGDNTRPSRNTITVSQEGPERNEAELDLLGDDNTVDILQNGSANNATVLIGDPPSGNFATFNTVDIDQNGSGHTATVSIEGSGNSSTITQSN